MRFAAVFRHSALSAEARVTNLRVLEGISQLFDIRAEFVWDSPGYRGRSSWLRRADAQPGERSGQSRAVDTARVVFKNAQLMPGYSRGFFAKRQPDVALSEHPDPGSRGERGRDCTLVPDERSRPPKSAGPMLAV